MSKLQNITTEFAHLVTLKLFHVTEQQLYARMRTRFEINLPAWAAFSCILVVWQISSGSGKSLWMEVWENIWGVTIVNSSYAKKQMEFCHAQAEQHIEYTLEARETWFPLVTIPHSCRLGMDKILTKSPLPSID